MREFKIGDIVRYNSPKEGYVYGRIDYIYDDNKLFVKNISKSFNSISIKPSEAECVEPEYLELKYVEIEAARNRIKDVSGNTLKPLRFNVPEAHDLAAPRYLWAKKAHPKARYNIREPMRRMVPVTFG